MKRHLLFTTTIFLCAQVLAQKTFKRNTLYAEIGGNGVVLSANYERQLSNKPGLAYHIGVGVGYNKPSVPMGIKYLLELGKGQRSFIETGVGVTIGSKYFWKEYRRGTDKNPYEPGFIASIGYRHHTRYGLLWRICYTPIFTSYRNIFYLGGISAGWRF
ncbi:MAG: hypothetical protein ABL876_15890 [Chitinophagaceae bacterium]